MRGTLRLLTCVISACRSCCEGFEDLRDLPPYKMGTWREWEKENQDYLILRELELEPYLRRIGSWIDSVTQFN